MPFAFMRWLSESASGLALTLLSTVPLMPTDALALAYIIIRCGSGLRKMLPPANPLSTVPLGLSQ